jgi:hypothetical protein
MANARLATTRILASVGFALPLINPTATPRGAAQMLSNETPSGTAITLLPFNAVTVELNIESHLLAGRLEMSASTIIISALIITRFFALSTLLGSASMTIKRFGMPKQDIAIEVILPKAAV